MINRCFITYKDSSKALLMVSKSCEYLLKDNCCHNPKNHKNGTYYVSANNILRFYMLIL